MTRAHQQDHGRELPRLAHKLLRLVVGDGDACDGMVGDLQEECDEVLGSAARPLRRWVWLWVATLGLAGRFIVTARTRGTRSRQPGLVIMSRGSGVVQAVRTDLAQALKKVRRSPGFTVGTVLILALGIGGATTVFSLVNGVLLKPLPYPNPDRLVGVWYSAPGLRPGPINQTPAGYLTYRSESLTMEDIGIWDNESLTVTGVGEAERVPAMMVTDGLFGLLGVRPILGRGFTPEDDAPGSPLTIVLGYGYWQRRFAGNPSAVGRTLTVDGLPREILGVMPQGFRILDRPADIYRPARFDATRVTVGDFSYQAIARLKPGVTLDEARADVRRMIPISIRRFPGGMSLSQAQSARLGPWIEPLRDELVGPASTPLWFLLGSAGLVLLIACANVANLLLVRGEGRRREVAVRAALGGGRARIVRQLLMENLLVGLLGGGLGVVLALGGVAALRTYGPQELLRLHEVGVDAKVLGFAMAVTLLVSLLFGAMPAARAARGGVGGALSTRTRGSSAGRGGIRSREVLVVAQVAVALVLLVGSSLMLRSFRALHDIQPGVRDPEHVLTFRVDVPEARVSRPADVALFYEEVVRELAALPGVVSVSGTNSVPMDGWDSNQGLYIEDAPTPAGESPPSARVKWVAGDYFTTLRTPMLAGRDLTWDDVRERANVVVVNQSYARLHWGDPLRALGRRVRYGRTEWRTVVGIAADTYDDGLEKRAVPTVYWPLAVEGFWGASLWVPRWFAYLVRTSAPVATSLVPDVRRMMARVAHDVPVFEVHTLDEFQRRSMLRTAWVTGILGIGTLIAVLLAVVGIYGVVAYGVAQRTREIGVRMALGAGRGHVRASVLRDGLRLLASGIVLGVAASLLLTRLMSSLLFGVQPTDLVSYVTAASVTAAVALAATYLPARRATRVAPVEALRAE